MQSALQQRLNKCHSLCTASKLSHINIYIFFCNAEVVFMTLRSAFPAGLVCVLMCVIV